MKALPRLAKRVLLIGWDAADWQLINSLLAGGCMPHLQGLIDRGVSGKISTLLPVLSPILWNSIATGKRGDKHGILGFVEPDPNVPNGIRPVSSTSRQAKAIWNILGQSGMRSCVVGWYASHPAEPINGYILTNRFAICGELLGTGRQMEAGTVHPPELRELAESLRVHPHSLGPKHVRPFLLNGAPDDPQDPRLGALVKILAECASIHNAATYFAEDEEWDLLAVYYDAIDHFCHGFMEYHPPRMAHVSERDGEVFGQVINSAYQFHDMMLGRLLELVGSETTVIILSDHGFFSNHMRPPVDPIPEGAPVSGDGAAAPKRRSGLAPNPVAWHRQQGMFVAAGPGIKTDELVHGASLLDVAPTILALLGLPVADDMDGRPLIQIFDVPSGEFEPGRIASYEPPHPEDGVHRTAPAEEQDPWAARQALEQLAALGYIELPDAGGAKEGTEKSFDPAKRALQERKNNLAQIYYTTGRYAEALSLLYEVLQSAGRDLPHVRCWIALCLFALHRPALAEEEARHIVKHFPGMPLGKLLLGQARLSAGDAEGALALLSEAESTESKSPYFRVLVGRAHLLARRWPEAEAAYRRALEIDDDSAEAHDGLGVALREQGQLEDALHEHMRAVSLLHHRAQTHVNLGIALAAAKQIDWAIRAFTVAAELAPEQPFPHRWLAQLYRRAKKDSAKAREHTLRAWELRIKLRGRTPAFIRGA